MHAAGADPDDRGDRQRRSGARRVTQLQASRCCGAVRDATARPRSPRRRAWRPALRGRPAATSPSPRRASLPRAGPTPTSRHRSVELIAPSCYAVCGRPRAQGAQLPPADLDGNDDPVAGDARSRRPRPPSITSAPHSCPIASGMRHAGRSRTLTRSKVIEIIRVRHHDGAHELHPPAGQRRVGRPPRRDGRGLSRSAPGMDHASGIGRSYYCRRRTVLGRSY